MKLWIRRQDRKALVKASCILIQDNKILDVDDGDHALELGIYTTEKQRLEVLDEIQCAILNEITVYEMPKNKGVDYESNIN